MTTPSGDELRHEVKYVGYATELGTLRAWLRHSPERFIDAYPPRQVNNVYFDNFEFRAYSQNLAGVSERSKVRYRWYGEDRHPGKGVLEVKRKRNLFGWKLRFPIDEPQWTDDSSWREIIATIRAELPLDGRLWLDQNPLPALLNSYHREYYVSSDGAVRATIDTAQRVWDQRFARTPNLERAGALEDTVVVEFKFPREQRLRASRMFEGFPLRLGRHSKYMNGMRSVALV